MQEGQPTAEITFAVREAGGSRSAVVLRLRHNLDADCGGHRVALGCALWVYNQTGLPIALQMAGRSDEEVRTNVHVVRYVHLAENLKPALPVALRPAVRFAVCPASGGSVKGRGYRVLNIIHGLLALQDGDDEVPKQWLPPYAGPGATVSGSAERAPPAGRAARAGGSARAGPRVGPQAGVGALAQDVRISSKPDLRGLGQALARGGERGTLGCAPFVAHSSISPACYV